MNWMVAHQGDGTHLKLSPIDSINWQIINGQAAPFFARIQKSVEERDRWIKLGIKFLDEVMQQKSRASRFIYVYEALGRMLYEKAIYSGQMNDFEEANSHWRKSYASFTDDQLTNHQRTMMLFADALYVGAGVGNTVSCSLEALRLLEPVVDDMRLEL